MAEESSEETKRKFKKRKKKSEIQLKNIQSRIEISNFLLRSDDNEEDKEFHETWHKLNPSPDSAIKYKKGKKKKERK